MNYILYMKITHEEDSIESMNEFPEFSPRQTFGNGVGDRKNLSYVPGDAISIKQWNTTYIRMPKSLHYAKFMVMLKSSVTSNMCISLKIGQVELSSDGKEIEEIRDPAFHISHLHFKNTRFSRVLWSKTYLALCLETLNFKKRTLHIYAGIHGVIFVYLFPCLMLQKFQKIRSPSIDLIYVWIQFI